MKKIGKYQVVKSLRNWASAKAKKAERRGTLEGIMDDVDEIDRNLAEVSPTVITSSIETQRLRKRSNQRKRR